MGRFITADPTIQRPTDPQDFNRYAYCRNNPITFTDPTGLGWFKKLISAIVGAVVGTVTFIATGNYNLAFKVGISAYRATEAILSGANVKETITAGINGYGEGEAILRDPRKIGSLLGDPVTDRLTPDGRRAMNGMLRSIGLDPVSAKHVGRALEGALTSNNRSFDTIVTGNGKNDGLSILLSSIIDSFGYSPVAKDPFPHNSRLAGIEGRYSVGYDLYDIILKERDISKNNLDSFNSYLEGTNKGSLSARLERHMISYPLKVYESRTDAARQRQLDLKTDLENGRIRKKN